MFKVGKFVLYAKTYYTYEVVETATTKVLALKHSKTKRIYAMPHTSKLRLASPEEISAGHRIDTNTGVTVITPKGTSKVKGGLTAFVDMGDDTHIEKPCERVIMTRQQKVYLIRAMRYDIAREIAASFGLAQCGWRFVSDREELQPPFGLPRGYKWTDAIPLKRRKADDYTLEIAEQRWVEEIARYFGEH